MLGIDVGGPVGGIIFSTARLTFDQVVPEPPAVALLLAGVVCVAMRRCGAGRRPRRPTSVAQGRSFAG